jgi:predicted acylesterase/phospholipase RssA
MARIGLALSGGGSKGAFTVGALKVVKDLLEPEPYPVISGTSTGALIGTLLATRQFARLVEIYSHVETENIVNPHHALVAAIAGPEAVLFAAALLGGRAIYDSEALRTTARANVDFEVVRKAGEKTLLIYNAVDLQTGELTTFDNRTHSAAALLDALMASANMPVLMDPVVIRGPGGGDQYVDGGVREFLPLAAVFSSGIEIDHIMAISTAPLSPRPKRGSFDRIVDILGRTVDLLNSEIGKDDYHGAELFNAILRIVENGEAAGVSATRLLRGVPAEVRARIREKRAVPVSIIAPRDHLDMDPLEFEPSEMQRAMRLGVEAAKKVVPKVLEALPEA